MMRTAKRIEYKATPYGLVGTIPKGTPVIPASNLPDVGHLRYWAEPWPGMTEEEASWQRTYGYLLEREEVEDAE